MNFSLLTRESCADAVALWSDAGLTRPWNDPVADFHLAIASPTSTIVGVFDGDLLVGTAMVGFDGHRAWVYYLAVARSHRGHGLGRELMSRAESWAMRSGAPKVQLMVRSENHSVIEFYERLGYRLDETVVLGRRLDTPRST